jgi:hypothetical protein
LGSFIVKLLKYQKRSRQHGDTGQLLTKLDVQTLIVATQAIKPRGGALMQSVNIVGGVEIQFVITSDDDSSV